MYSEPAFLILIETEGTSLTSGFQKEIQIWLRDNPHTLLRRMLFIWTLKPTEVYDGFLFPATTINNFVISKIVHICQYCWNPDLGYPDYRLHDLNLGSGESMKSFGMRMRKEVSWNLEDTTNSFCPTDPGISNLKGRLQAKHSRSTPEAKIFGLNSHLGINF